MVTSGDSVGNMNPYVFIDVMTGDDQTVVASATSKTASSVVITEEMWEDPDFVVAVGVRMDTGTGAFNARTIWPMLLIKPEVESPILVNEWDANSAGVYMYNFVPYFAPYENPVDLTKDRYGYSGDCVVMEDSYKVHRRMTRVVFDGSEIGQNSLPIRHFLKWNRSHSCVWSGKSGSGYLFGSVYCGCNLGSFFGTQLYNDQ